MHLLALICSTTLSFAAFVAVPLSALAQEIAIRVNGEPITSRDIVQRTLYQSLPSLQNRINDFYERLNALLSGDKLKEKFRQKMSVAQPRTAAEAKRIAERIKNELIEDATMQILSERGAARKSVIDALIDDKLKLQAAKRLGIEIADEEVVKSIIVDGLVDGEQPDVNAYFAQRVAYGVGRKTIQEIIRAQLAWRAVMNRTFGTETNLERNGAYESFSRGYLEKLRQNAIINYPAQHPGTSIR
jgi:peptidyl-prolyl cis-trans isomerase SurA